MMTFMLTGLDIDAKAAVAEQALWNLIEGGKDAFEEVHTDLCRPANPDGPLAIDATGQLRIVVKDRDPDKVGRAFSGRVVETGLASYPGLFTSTPPTPVTEFGVYWPTLVNATAISEIVHFENDAIPVVRACVRRPEGIGTEDDTTVHTLVDEPTTLVPLGTLVGARSGDKGGNVTVGFWVTDADAWAWLDAFLTVDRFRDLAPETIGLMIHRHRLPNLKAINLIVYGLLGRGVAASSRVDAQGKGVGEYLRARSVPIPKRLLGRAHG